MCGTMLATFVLSTKGDFIHESVTAESLQAVINVFYRLQESKILKANQQQTV